MAHVTNNCGQKSARGITHQLGMIDNKIEKLKKTRQQIEQLRELERESAKLAESVQKALKRARDGDSGHDVAIDIERQAETIATACKKIKTE